MRWFVIGVSLASLWAACLSVGMARPQVAVESNVRPRVIGGKTWPSERDEQEALFNYYFHDQKLKYETRLSRLKTAASVPGWRIPYSGWIYPRSSGGMSSLAGGGGRSRGGYSPLAVYDNAFHNGQSSANSNEQAQVLGGGGSGWFLGARMRRANEGWEGYCSGLTAASIRHPEPIHAVDAATAGGTPGVIFQPSDIKALLACIYNRTVDASFLYLAPPSAWDGGPNMGTFHLALANYIGQAGCPVGIDRTKGRAPWNNPIYDYKIDSLSDAGQGDHLHYKLVDATITYSYYSSDYGQQTDSASGEVRDNQRQAMALRYYLAVDDQDRIVGGTALSDSGHFLWLPLYAVQAKEDGAAPGNPHLDVRKVLALARASANPATQKKFDAVTIGPRIDPALSETPGAPSKPSPHPAPAAAGS